MIRILKYPIPIDDQWHEIPAPWHQGDKLRLSHPYFHIGMQQVDLVWKVMIWIPQPDGDLPDGWMVTNLKVVGTGHLFEEEDLYIGSTQDPRGFVWHVIAQGQA